MAAGASGARMIGGGEGGSSTGRHMHGTQHFLQPHHHQYQYQQLHGTAPSSAPSQVPLRSPVASSPSPLVQTQSPVPTAGAPPVIRAPTPTVAPNHGPYPSQQHLLQRQQLVLPLQPQLPRSPAQAVPQQQSFNFNQSSSQHMQMYQQQQSQQRNEHRYPQIPQQQQHRLSQTRPATPNPMVQASQRSMGNSHPSTAPIRLTPRVELAPHLGISADSPTPEQLAQRFVQQVALQPGQHNELAKRLHAQFQQFFPPHHQAEAKRQFSFHAREYFARYQRQQELLRNSSTESSRQHPNGRLAVPGTPSGSFMAAQQPAACPSPVGTARSLAPESDQSKQGTPRRRSDMDSDDEDAGRSQSGPHPISTGISVPMLTQDLTTTMSLSTEISSGPLPTSYLDARTSDGSYPPSSSAAAFTHGSDATKTEQASSRDFKVRKLMAREDSSSQGASSSAGLAGHEPASHGDEWSYSRHMAKDGAMNP
ncbi:hypothetical protein BGZ65_007025 [Modicella reniformis]|uniref:Uncharacterized protein n=1 Tax=Modicella reniformis TaxID=1440133 RepID=A0A9P6JH14_9FUNG|nr:hypothetical protein BGZ65_007025 [Modicella reniformis]